MLFSSNQWNCLSVGYGLARPPCTGRHHHARAIREEVGEREGCEKSTGFVLLMQHRLECVTLDLKPLLCASFQK
jgi:hypothetical protein